MKMAEENSGKISDAAIIIICDSDSEADVKPTKKEENVLFDEFVTCCHEFMIKIRGEEKVHKIEKHLLKCHKAARQEYLSSEEFTNILSQHLVELRKPDYKKNGVFSHVHDVVVHLKNAATKHSKQKSKEKSNADEKKCKVVVNGSVHLKSQASEDKVAQAKADGVGKDNPCNNKEVVGISESLPECGSGDGARVSKSLPASGSKDEASTSEGACENKDTPGTSGTSPTGDATQQRIRRLEKLMGRLDREIRRYSEKELSLDDLGNDDSAHMIEHKLRKRFVEAWEKWCKLKGYEGKTGRVIEKKVRFQGTRYPEINRKIEKMVNRNKFPDFHDVYHVIERTNESKKLGIHRFDLREISKEVFEDIGEKLSQRRNEDLVFNFGYATLSGIPSDPAQENTDLKRKLEENAAVGKQMMESVLEKYTRKQNELLARGTDIEFDNTSEPEAVIDDESDEEELDTIEDESDSKQETTADEEKETVKVKTNGSIPEQLPSKRLHEDISSSLSEEKPVKHVKTEKETASPTKTEKETASPTKTESEPTCTLNRTSLPGSGSIAIKDARISNPIKLNVVKAESRPGVLNSSKVVHQGSPIVKRSVNSVTKPVNYISVCAGNPLKANGKHVGVKPSQVRTSDTSATPGRVTSLSRSVHSTNGTTPRRITTSLISSMSNSQRTVQGPYRNIGRKPCSSSLRTKAMSAKPKATTSNDDDDDDDDVIIVLD